MVQINARTEKPEMNSKLYLEYLDKEMTLMGILSAISIAAPAAILNTFVGAEGTLKAKIWNEAQFFILVGSIFSLLAALMFYKQRSRLAWFYGQICLTETLNEGAALKTSLRDWLEEADAWETWIPYVLAFTALIGGGLCLYLCGVIFFLFPGQSIKWKVALACFCIGVALIVALIQRHVYRRYKFSDTPWEEYYEGVIDKWKRIFKKRLPNSGVYARLKPSNISGVGVFAIADIPKGTYIFEPDDSPTVRVPAKEVDALSVEHQKLYEDFCVLEKGKYICPTSFNQLTPSWFLNHSNDPNAAPDSSLKFYAIKDIKSGEEITANYNTYSDKQREF